MHALALGTLNGTAYPLPKLNVVGKYDAFYEGQSILFDASSSYLPPPFSDASYYYYKFQIGTQVFETIGNPRVSAVLTAGTYDVSLSINDQPFNGSGSSSYGLTRGGYPAPITGIQLRILPLEHCYEFKITTDWNPYISLGSPYLRPYGGGDVTIWVSVMDHRDTSDISENALSDAFWSIGESPSLQLSNGTHTFQFSFKDFDYASSRWKIDLPFDHFNSSWPVTGVFIAKGTSIQSCTIGSQTVDLTFPWIQSLSFGYNMQNLETNGLNSGMLLNSSDYVPHQLKLSFDRCNRKQGIATFGVSSLSASTTYLGALSAITSNTFENFTLHDFSRSSDNLRNTTNSICAHLNSAACANIQIMDSIIVDSHLITLTTGGLFLSQSFITQTSSTIAASFQKIFPLSDDFSLMNSSRLFGKSDCLHTFQDFIYLVYYNTTSKLIYGTSDQLQNADPKWQTISIGDISGIDSSQVFFSAGRDFIRQNNVYLIGNSLYGNDAIACSGNSSCRINNASFVVDSTEGSLEVSFSFPPNLTICGMEFQSKTNNIFVYGSEVKIDEFTFQIWVSSDGGFSFFVIQSGLFSDDEYVSEFDSGIYSDSFIFRTNSNRVFYGSSLSSNIFEIRTITSHHNELMSILAENTGALWSFTIPSNFSGFVSPSGLIKVPSEGVPFLLRRRIPILEEKVNLDESSGLNLVPIWNGDYSMQFYVNGNSTISKDFSGFKIVHDNGGEFSISRTSLDGKIFYGNMKSAFTPESSSQSPAVLGILGVQGITSAIDVLVRSYPTLPIDGVDLILSNISNTGWLLSDIGKTILFHSGSILVTSVTNETHAIGTIIFPPKSDSDAYPGTWTLYDFRSYYEYPTEYSQGLTVISNSSGTFGYPAPNASDIQNSYLLTDSGWGIVNAVQNGYMLISPFSAFLNGLYVAGSWRLVKSSLYHTSGYYPTAENLRRRWRIALDECPVLSSNSLIRNPIQYVSYDFNDLYQSSYRFAVLKNFSVIPEVNLKLVNSDDFSKNISSFWNPSSMLSEMNISLTDNGSPETFLLNLKPSLNSLSCKDNSQTIFFLNMCNSPRLLQFKSNITSSDFLAGTLYDFEASSYVIESLPYNYRPPSTFGGSVPISNNIYNAAPEKPRYKDIFEKSKSSGTYKACLGKPNRAACGCNDAKRLSMDLSNSDCIDRALRISYYTPYTPKFELVSNGVSAAINSKYWIWEVNNRTDYCISSVGNCNHDSALSAKTIDPGEKEGLIWKGSELYHFRIQLVDRKFCNLSTEFIVYVYNEPPNSGREWLLLCLSGAFFGLSLLSGYIYKRLFD